MNARATMRVAEVAEVLDLSRDAVYDAVRRGEFTNAGVGRSVRIPRHEVEARLGRGRVSGGAVTVQEGVFT